MSVVGSLGIKDNMTAAVRSIRKEQSLFRSEVAKVKKELAETWDKKRTAKLDATAANKIATGLTKKLEPLRKKIATVIAYKDNATNKIKAVTSKARALGKIVAAPVVKLKDMVTRGIKGIGGKLKSLAKNVVIPVTVAASVAVAGAAAAVKDGMALEKQQISIEHFVGATNKNADQSTVKKISSEYMNALRENANATPFETGDVIAAGSRAIAVASGNTKEAMGLVTLAEDMAAASGGTKSISDAIEALADAKLGETERLKEFGFKVSADEFKSKGFVGVTKDLGNFYGGASEKLAGSGAGLVSTIMGKLKSNFADFGLKIVEKLKPAFDSIIGLIDKMSPVMEQFGGKIADGIGKGIEFVGNAVPKVLATLQTFKPFIDTIITSVQTLAPVMQTMGATMAQCWSTIGQAVLPVISSIVNIISTTLPAIMPIIQTVMTTIAALIAGVMPVISIMVDTIGSVISTLAPIFQEIFGKIAEIVGPVIEFVAEKMGWVGEIISTVAPIISEILSAAWAVIEPVLSVVMEVFKVLWSVVEAVFPPIQKVIEVVWKAIKPVVEVIGKVLGAIGEGIGWIADKLSGESSSSSKSVTSEIGTNATGTNNWRGGVTWVGEKGPELLEVPRGARILPNKESVSVSGRQSTKERIKGAVNVTIAKLADQVIVRDESDIERIGETLVQKVLDALDNLAPETE